LLYKRIRAKDMPRRGLSKLHLISICCENNMACKLRMGQILPIDLKEMPTSKVQGPRVQGSRFKVQGSGFRVQGSGFRVQGSRLLVARYSLLVTGCCLIF
jgi:hypothetical protein